METFILVPVPAGAIHIALGNQRKFFDTFARSKKFNPLDAENWRSVSHDDIIRAVSSAHFEILFMFEHSLRGDWAYLIITMDLI